MTERSEGTRQSVWRVSALLLLATVAWAKGPGGTAADFLNLEGDARAGALGGAFSGLVAGEPSALGWNPAGLGGFHGQAVQFTHLQWLGDVTYEAVSYAKAIEPRGGLGVRAIYAQSGEMTRTSEDPGTGTFAQESGSFRNSDLAVTVGIGQLLGRAWRVGGAVTYLRDSVAGDTAASVAADAGLHLALGSDGAHGVGVSMQNLGGRLGGSALPLLVRAGAGGRFLRDRALQVAAEGRYAVEGGRLSLGGGVEYWIVKAVAARVGYRQGGAGDLGRGLTAGAGLRWRGWTADYGFSPAARDFAPAHRVTLTLRWGA